MSLAPVYVTEAVENVVKASHSMRPPLKLSGRPKLPVTRQEITRYVERLLTPQEQEACDRATD